MGNGDQKVVSIVQNHKLPRVHQGTQSQTARLVQAQCSAYCSHKLENHSARPQNIEKKQVLLHDLG